MKALFRRARCRCFGTQYAYYPEEESACLEYRVIVFDGRELLQGV